jgi:hypothetical protein
MKTFVAILYLAFASVLLLGQTLGRDGANPLVRNPAVDRLERLSKTGSEREFVRRGILRGLPHFLKSDVFNVGSSHALYLEE